MKINKEYISMCEKAKEIQKLAKDQIKGIVILTSHNNILGEIIDYRNSEDGIEIGIIINDKILWYYEDMIEYIWLPRQDQLQEIIEMCFTKNEHPRFTLLGLLYESEATYKGDRSFEIAWLTLLMELNFNKIWNEEKEVWNKIG